MSGEVAAVKASTEECRFTHVSPTLDDVHLDAIGEITKNLNGASPSLLCRDGSPTEWDRSKSCDQEMGLALSAKEEEDTCVSHELPQKLGLSGGSPDYVERSTVLHTNNKNVGKQSSNLAAAETSNINNQAGGISLQYEQGTRHSPYLSNLDQLNDADYARTSPPTIVSGESKECHREIEQNFESPLQLSLAEGTSFDSSEPGPSGLHLTAKQKSNAVHSESDSGSCDSVIIIEKPKKEPVMIVLSDDPTSSEDDELVYVRRKRKSNMTLEQNTVQGKGKGARNKSRVKRLDPIKEKLEGKRNEIFDLKPDPDGGQTTPTDGRDLTCAICLGEFENQAFLDQCFHSFCYACILQWAEVVKQCPLCKTEFKSLIHTVTKDLSYQQHFFHEEETTQLSAKVLMEQVLNGISDDRQRFQYRSTMTTERWRQLEREQERRQEEQRRSLKRRKRYLKSVRHREAASVERRRMIYRTGMEVKEVKTHGKPRQRDISVEFIQRNPAVTHRLVGWLLRDIRVLVGNNDDHVHFLMHFILSLVTKVAMDSEAFYQQLEPFFFANTRRFIRELISFAQSPYDVEGYDSNVVYALPETGTTGTTAGTSTSSAPIPGRSPVSSACADLTQIRGTDSFQEDIASGTSLSSQANQGQFSASAAPARACSSEDEISVVRVVRPEENATSESPWNLRNMIDRYHDKRREEVKGKKERDFRRDYRSLASQSSSVRKEEPISSRRSQDSANIASNRRSSEEWLTKHYRSSRTENAVQPDVWKEAHSQPKGTRNIRSVVSVPSQIVDSPRSASRSRSSRGPSSCTGSPTRFSDSDPGHLHSRRRERKYCLTSPSQTNFSENSPNSNSFSRKTSRSSSSVSSRKRNSVNRSHSRSRSRSRSRSHRESRRRRRRKNSSPLIDDAQDESLRTTQHIPGYGDVSCGRSRAASGSSATSVLRSPLSLPFESYTDLVVSSAHSDVDQRMLMEDSDNRGRSRSRSSGGSPFVEFVRDNDRGGDKSKNDLSGRISPAGELRDVPVDSDYGTESIQKHSRDTPHRKRKKSKSRRKRQSRTQSLTEEECIRSSDGLPSTIMPTTSADCIAEEVSKVREPSERDLLIEIKKLEKEIRKRRRLIGKLTKHH